MFEPYSWSQRGKARRSGVCFIILLHEKNVIMGVAVDMGSASGLTFVCFANLGHAALVLSPLFFSTLSITKVISVRCLISHMIQT